MKRRDFMKAGVGTAACVGMQGALPLLAQEANKQGLNVLFLGVDDLRCNLGCYGDTMAVTPNIDRLASMGTLFKRAYVQQAVCAASRAGFLTGCRPETTTVDYPYNKYFIDEFLPAHPSVPLYFKQQGYHMRSGGKIHHGGHFDLRNDGYQQNWWYRDWYYDEQGNKVQIEDIRKFLGNKEDLAKAKAGGFVGDYALPFEGKPPAYECADVPDTDYRDGRVAEAVLDALRNDDCGGRPFFFAVGLTKPHLPFNAPKKYWDLYDRDAFALPENRFLAENVTRLANASYEMPAYAGGQIDFNDEERLRLLTHGYYACTSFTDAHIGKLLDELDRQKLMDRTLIVMWSDHGFHLGENQSFGKHTTFEVATHSPLIVAAPGYASGRVSDALVEYVDMFPTLCDLAGVTPPDYLEGTSLVPLLEDPGRSWKEAAYSQWPRSRKQEGFSVRTDRYRYTEWWHRDDPSAPFEKIVARELYDHETDPGETVNRADDQPERVKELAPMIKAHWSKALPTG